MGKHQRPDKSQQPNAILHMGARPLPDGNIEMMVIIRLDDCNYQLHKIVSLGEYQITLEGLDLCAKTASHQAHQRALSAARAPEEESGSSSPRSGSAPFAPATLFTGTSTAPDRVPGAPTSPSVATRELECASNDAPQPGPEPAQ